MPVLIAVVIVLLVIIILLMGGWVVIAAILGAIATAIALVIAGIVWLIKTTWMFLLGAFALFLLLALVGTINEKFRLRVRIKRPTDEAEGPKLPPILKSRAEPRPPIPTQPWDRGS